ncbi:DNA ligase D [Oceanobacillus luteolus]|uniref:DNA ligase D n=1 Tax=Oceanobacillus luteolus TaxID=1274358 RepID=UPI00203C88FF|nr:DNA ligase D [Oceanobacillus luteolus]MCM3741411.1 DNA ligase D [Oceanobacillus luteolus]
MQIMKPIYRDDVPVGEEWLYEIKYDGFRALLSISADGKVTLKSRNNHDLTDKFPEVVRSCVHLLPAIKGFLPLVLDGELVVLNNKYQANFSELQKRGRMRNLTKIEKAAQVRPASFIAFDILEVKGKIYDKQRLSTRNKILEDVFKKVQGERLQLIEVFQDLQDIKKIVFDFKGEGFVAKRKNSIYLNGKKHQDWFKIKNWRLIHGILSSFDIENGYFDVAVTNGQELRPIGKCKHGLDAETFQTLRDFFTKNGERNGNKFTVPPAICAAIHTLDLYDQELREPEFAAVLPTMKMEECTIEKLKLDLAMLPEEVELTNTDKLLWNQPGFSKGNLLTYIREISPYMLPFIRDRLLTVIRAPDGVEAEQFFQKHLPSYAPDFVTAVPQQGETFCSCDNLESLVWFANHGAVEYHVPFQRSGSVMPLEIVFDLDPPDREHFQLSVQAAQLVKVLLDELSLQSFVKTSGNKGLQIHIPIREGSMTYEETAIFTQAIAFTIEKSYPDKFTTERMKNKRNGRLYIDYVQHGKDKTIIAPYSPRKTMEGTVATPLFWEEVDSDLDPTIFTIDTVVERVKQYGCPFGEFEKARVKQNMKNLLNMVRNS